MIWLVDYNHYDVQMDEELAKIRKDYFSIKRYVRYQKIGLTAPVQTKTYSNGLLRIATILAHNNIDVRYVHFYMLDDLIAKEQIPEIVAFSAVCPSVPRCASVAEKIKQISPSTKIYLGGAHVNQVPEETQKRYPVFDKMCVGYEKQAAEIIAGRELMCVPDPYVDYALLPFQLSDYSINTFTTTGCPFHCDYCVDGTAPHFKAMKDGNLSIMKSLLPPRSLVHFFDSILGYDQKGTFEVCKTLQEIQHDFIISCDMRADFLNPNLLNEMTKAGIREIRMGMDTASEVIQKWNHRTIMPETLLDQLKMIRDNSDMYVALYSITGLPGTTIEQHQLTLDCIQFLFEEKLVDEIKNAMYVPYPMKGVDYSKRGVYITNQDWYYYDRGSFPVYRLDAMSEQEIWDLMIETSRIIVENWLKSCGFEKISDIPDGDYGYVEYYENAYKLQ